MRNRTYTILFLFFVSFQLLSFKCNTTDKQEIRSAIADTDKFAKFEFENTEHDFGDIKQGDVLLYSFKYKNVGKTHLIIRNVTASCGCTVPNWNKEPLPPNEESEIQIQFNTSGRRGGQHKTIRIFANTKEIETQLSFTAQVILPEGENNNTHNAGVK